MRARQARTQSRRFLRAASHWPDPEKETRYTTSYEHYDWIEGEAGPTNAAKSQNRIATELDDHD